jgi:hypothetical protein
MSPRAGPGGGRPEFASGGWLMVLRARDKDICARGVIAISSRRCMIDSGRSHRP